MDNDGAKPDRKKAKRSPSLGDKSINGPLDTAVVDSFSVSSQGKILDQYPNVLVDLVSPGRFQVNDFLQTHFRQKAYHVPAVNKENKGESDEDATPGVHPRMQRIVDELFGLDPEQIMEHTASENIFVWLQDKDSSLIRSIEVGDAETAMALHKAGHPTYCRAPPALEELLVPALLNDTGLGCGQYDNSSGTASGRGEIEIFMSANPGQVTEWHYDFQENFTLQLSGRKKWTLQHSTVDRPLNRAVTPHYQSEGVVEGQLLAARMASSQCRRNVKTDDSFQFGPPHPDQRHNAKGPTMEAILEPGDVLYFPAGMWHKVEVLEPGISMNISLMATNYASLTCQALQHLLLQRSPSWRQTILTRHYEAQEEGEGVACRKADGNGNREAPSAVEQLQHLLEHDLPNVLQDLIHKQGGAAAVLPPVLRHGKKPMELKTKDDDEDETMEVDNNSDEQQIDDGGSVIDIDSQPPVPACGFDPSPSALREKLKTHRLIQNPMACLIRQEDITRHYNKKAKAQEGLGADPEATLYVLNFNFAGNEAYESVFRAVLSSTEYANLDAAFLDEKKTDDFSLSASKESSDPVGCNVVMWLEYVGYLVWVKRRI